MIQARDEETIIAQCTPQGAGAIALLRLSGINAFAIVNKISKLTSGKAIADCASHTIHAGWVVALESREPIDYVLFLLMRGPKTFTGQNTIEITCHNNQFIIEQIINEALAAGARLAQEGEFSKRSFLNNKIDLVQAESINELINASNTAALKQSLAQMEGTFSSWVMQLEKDLLKAVAFAEASFEFLDEEMDFGPQIAEILTSVLHKINHVQIMFDQRSTIKEGIRIALIGLVNAGKSSLFNALLGKSRAIVAPVPGTTRDVIEAGMYRNNHYLTLVDTAGIRETDNIIEQEGIRRSLQEAERADIVLIVWDSSQDLDENAMQVYQKFIAQHTAKSIVVQTKIDLPVANSELVALVQARTSTHNAESIDQLCFLIDAHIKNIFSHSTSSFLVNKRHYNLLTVARTKIVDLQLLLQEFPIAYELVSHDLRNIIEYLSEITGKTVDEQTLDAVFREFCVGK